MSGATIIIWVACMMPALALAILLCYPSGEDWQ